MKKKILYAVLNWGLGHATRSMPIIKELIKDNEVILVSTSRSLLLLKKEFPELEIIDYPDYSIKYTKHAKFLFISLALQIPKILIGLYREHKFAAKITREKKIDLIISDNRYGIYNYKVPSYFITHQLRFKMPKGLKFLENLTEYFNKFYFRKYKKIFIPDNENEPNFSGKLSHNTRRIKKGKLRYVGLLSDTKETESIISDYLVLISGPEPQRTKFENMVREQIKDIEGKKILVLGKTEIEETESEKDLEIYSHLSREKISKMINGAGLIISRPGYSTVMEVAAAGKKALFIPTPGQTEQEYLAEYYKDKGLFHYVPQNEMNLKNDIPAADEFKAIEKQKVNDIEMILKELEL
ncbi:MAG: glycosyltransferase [Candidatus Delongbacteria bacterium]|nr:glycosyltransferase [Candidatus Delongbacteria bacterium]